MTSFPLRWLVLGAMVGSAAGVCCAAPPARNHPIIGTFNLLIPGSDCTESWEFRADGTTHNISAGEESTSEYEISDVPDQDGFYTLSDTIKETNGKPDCLGNRTPVGDHAVNFLRKTTEGFVLCTSHNHDSCIMPMRRVGKDTFLTVGLAQPQR